MLGHSIGLSIVLVLFIEVASAQFLDWNRVFPALTKEDIEIIGQAEVAELDGKPDGSVVDWNNSKSGASGQVTLRKRFFVEGQECRELLHSIKVKGSETWYYLNTICLSDGNWKLLKPPRHVRRPANQTN